MKDTILQTGFVGTFDENVGVVTSKTYKEMKKIGRDDLDLEEQARQYAVMNQALANMMPEDAAMVYGQEIKNSGTPLKSSTDSSDHQ